ncbi:Threonine/homoserine/homoserine lactone efflux protein [Variovorax sp. YR752]|jgi:threonine/homoserine/homoserine lactone efflux protein|uniref:LysE family translocator n=1 Tax=Variovorax sp. YR752 TaxID=1884383 RepID=UPI000BDD9BA7|nr:LysE family translocator [Variovorax sp. YR752]SOD26242.1 Threonine/homoserine/homoserine lactone efflux protein [Variovorax sp. YR752]
MVPLTDLAIFAGAVVLLAITPGPNMVYLISRSICQGRQAGFVSLLGVLAGFIAHMMAAALGLSALFVTVPLAYELLKWAGAVYLAYLAWQAVRPGARSPFQGRQLPHDSPRKLFVMGLLTNLLNPKVAFFYLSLFPQFISPEHGSLFAQSLILGATQIAISFVVLLTMAMSASRIAGWFEHNPHWLAVQRYAMGSVLAGLAARLAISQRPGA